MRKILSVAAAVAICLSAAGCAATRNIGYAGQHPGFQEIECEGEIGITGSSTITGSLAYGGSATNTFSLNGKCGNKFRIGRSQGMVGGNASVVAPPK